MKHFDSIKLSASACRRELAEFKSLLDSHSELSEKADVLPFFRANPNLAAFIGMRGSFPVDRLAFEYDLFGNFKCDLVLGNRHQQAYTLVEFEDARPESIFHQTTRETPDWATRFERGYSQVVDWLWKLDDQRVTRDFQDRFGDGEVGFLGMLVVGCSRYLGQADRHRFAWRLNKVLVNNSKIVCMTFDDLYEDLSYRLEALKEIFDKPN